MPPRATRPSTSAPRTRAGLPLPERGARVRMYRHGFGDCFLLSFSQPGAPRPAHMVIDCGLLTGAPSPDRVRDAVQQIADETAGELDVLVCTHEHADHLSGFLHARDIWQKIRVNELWLAWTEDPTSDIANRLRDQRNRRRAGLESTARRLRALGAAASTSLAEVDAALAFFGAGRSKTQEALAFVRTLSTRPPRYLQPNMLPDIAGLPGVRFHVLGPPMDEEMLKKDGPTAGAGSEVYHAAAALTADAAFFAAAIDAPPPDDGDAKVLAERSAPFESMFRIPESAVSKPPADAPAHVTYLHEHYHATVRHEIDRTFVGSREVRRAEWTARQDWRRIDADWLSVAGALAMKLDEDTNNTSLVLAIELINSGRVLLFPGDAQVGNWLSWDRCAFEEVGPDGATRRVKAEDLLARTVLYKVGHHGSHNATLKDKGLLRMKSNRLVAMIPVDEPIARKQGRHGWNMPYPPLLAALQDRTAGRVLRADAGVPTPPQAGAWFAASVAEHPLFIDLTVEDR